MTKKKQQTKATTSGSAKPQGDTKDDSTDTAGGAGSNKNDDSHKQPDDGSRRPTDVVVADRSQHKESLGDDEEVSVPTLEEVEDDSFTQRRKKRRESSMFHSPRRYFVCAVGLWVCEFVIVLVLKRYGIIAKDFRLEDKIVRSVLPRFEESWKSLNESIPLSYLTQEKKRPGFQLAEAGARANYPVIIVPGFVTSGLEVWAGRDCAKKHFRQRLWAAFGGARSFLMERDCWQEHMKLDIKTGGDPDEIRLRAASGYEAVDYFMGNYWVFGKMIENLADLGYSPSDAEVMPFDWRLAFQLLEKRDGFFSRLKAEIEIKHRVTGRKVVLISHSMGVQVCHYFFAWVSAKESNGGGGGGQSWVDDHIHTYVNIAGSHLGVMKAATALLSGEISDAVFLGAFGDIIEQFFGRILRRELWSTWGSLWAMLPRGGNAIWGPGADMCGDNSTKGKDLMCPESGLSPFIAMTDSAQYRTQGVKTKNETDDANDSMNATIRDLVQRSSHTVEDINKYIFKYGAGLGSMCKNTEFLSPNGMESPSDRLWSDASKTPLPKAPNMRIFCMYGVGLETERAYYYKRNREEGPEGQITGLLDPPVAMNVTYMDEENGSKYGIRYGTGDGSVPLLSLGYICADAWRRKETGLNPGNAKVYVREYPHKPEFTVDDPMRGGPHSAEHVDILGNVDMMDDLMRIVSDFEIEKVQDDKISSDLLQIIEKINAHPQGGIKAKKRGIFGY